MCRRRVAPVGGRRLVDRFCSPRFVSPLVIARDWFRITQAQIQSFIYLKLAVAGHLTLFVARTRRTFLSTPYPAPVLLVGMVGTQILAAMIVGFGWFVTPIAWKCVGFVWLSCLVWVFVDDWAKLHVYCHLEMTGKTHRKFLGQVHGSFHSYTY